MKKTFIAAAMALAMMPLAAQADEHDTPETPDLNMGSTNDRFTLAAGASTLGASVQPAMRVSDELVLRVSGNYAGFDVDREIEGVDYSADFDLKSAGVIADWHPFKSGFRLSGGVFYNGNGVDLGANGTANVGGATYNADLSGEIEFNEVSPYVGLGYDSALFNDSGWSLWAEAGVMYHGSPSVNLTDNTGNIASADLQRERADLESAIDVPVYPVVGVGLRYRF